MVWDGMRWWEGGGGWWVEALGDMVGVGGYFVVV